MWRNGDRKRSLVATIVEMEGGRKVIAQTRYGEKRCPDWERTNVMEEVDRTSIGGFAWRLR